MNSSHKNDQNSVYIEYCRSCDAHSWCTHHDESKYHETFLKLAQLIGKEFPTLDVVGNMVPESLLPFKINQNKYVDSITNKYVVFPAIGAFQVIYNGEIIFSKKNTNSWPNLYHVLDGIGKKLNGNDNQLKHVKKRQTSTPRKSDNFVKSPQKNNVQKDDLTQKDNYNNSYLDNVDKKSTFYKQKANNFTLTDHFKLYKSSKHQERKKESMTENQISQREIGSHSGSQFPQFKGQKHHERQHVSKSPKKDVNPNERIKDILLNRGGFMFKQGKKEMIVKLDSIEEQSLLVEDQRISNKHHNQNKKQKNNKMKQFDTQLSQLEDKFKTFEEKVNIIKKKNKEFQHKMPLIDDRHDRHEKHERNADYAQNQRGARFKYQSKELIEAELLKGSKNKLGEMDAYIHSSEKQKNQKLHRIYGEWKLTQNQKKKKQKLSKKKNKGLTEKDQILQSNEDDDSSLSSNTSSQIDDDESHQKQSFFERKKNKIEIEKKYEKKQKHSSIECYNEKSNKSLKMKTQNQFFRPNRLETMVPKPRNIIDRNTQSERKTIEQTDKEIDRVIRMENNKKKSLKPTLKTKKNTLTLIRNDREVSNKLISQEDPSNQSKFKRNLDKSKNHKQSSIQKTKLGELETKIKSKERLNPRQSQNSSVSNYYTKDQKRGIKGNFNPKLRFNNFHQVSESEKKTINQQNQNLSKRKLKKIENEDSNPQGFHDNSINKRKLKKTDENIQNRPSLGVGSESQHKSLFEQPPLIKKKPIRQIFGKIKKNPPLQLKRQNSSESSAQKQSELQIKQKHRTLTSEQSQQAMENQQSAKNTLKKSLYNEQKKKNELNVQKQTLNLSIDGKKTKKKKHRSKNAEEHVQQQIIQHGQIPYQENKSEKSHRAQSNSQQVYQDQDESPRFQFETIQEKDSENQRFATDRNTEDDELQLKNTARLQKSNIKSKKSESKFKSKKTKQNQNYNHQEIPEKPSENVSQNFIKQPNNEDKDDFSDPQERRRSNESENSHQSAFQQPEKQKENKLNKEKPKNIFKKNNLNENKSNKSNSKTIPQRNGSNESKSIKNKQKSPQKITQKADLSENKLNKSNSKTIPQRNGSNESKSIKNKQKSPQKITQKADLSENKLNKSNSKTLSQNNHPNENKLDKNAKTITQKNDLNENKSIKSKQMNPKTIAQKSDSNKNESIKQTHQNQNSHENIINTQKQDISHQQVKQNIQRQRNQNIQDEFQEQSKCQDQNSENNYSEKAEDEKLVGSPKKKQSKLENLSPQDPKQNLVKSNRKLQNKAIDNQEKEKFMDEQNSQNPQVTSNQIQFKDQIIKKGEKKKVQEKKTQQIKEQNCQNKNGIHLKSQADKISKKQDIASKNNQQHAIQNHQQQKIEANLEKQDEIHSKGKIEDANSKNFSKLCEQQNQIEPQTLQGDILCSEHQSTENQINQLENDQINSKKQLKEFKMTDSVAFNVEQTNSKTQVQKLLQIQNQDQLLEQNQSNWLQNNKKHGQKHRKMQVSIFNEKGENFLSSNSKTQAQKLLQIQNQDQLLEQNQRNWLQNNKKHGEQHRKMQVSIFNQNGENLLSSQDNAEIISSQTKALQLEQSKQQKERASSKKQIENRTKSKDIQQQQVSDSKINQNENGLVGNSLATKEQPTIAIQQQKTKQQNQLIQKKSQQQPQQKQNLEQKKKKKSQQNKAETIQKISKNNKPKIKVYDDDQEQYSNNVYTNSKKRAYIEVGVQKQLTIEASIQTDNYPLNYEENPFILPKNTNRAGEVHSQLSNVRPNPSVSRNQSFTEGENFRNTPPSSQRQNMNQKNDLNLQNTNSKNSNFKQNPTVPNQVIRAKILQQIYGESIIVQSKKYESLMKGQYTNDQTAKRKKSQQTQLKSLKSIYNSSPRPCLFDDQSLQINKVRSNKVMLSNFRKIIEILASKNQFILIRLYQNIKNVPLPQGEFYGIWLCNNYKWECVIVDDLVQVDAEGLPLYCYHEGQQIWVHILEKALAQILGGYSYLEKIECNKLFSIITGSNSLNFSIKEDPTKNSKFVKYVSECQNKNFVIHADKICKNIYQMERKRTDVSVYYIHSVKVVNGQETLLEISQNRKQPFWMKMLKFVQDFKTAQILQLRVNHNFTSLSVQKSKQSNLTVVELDFEQECFGSITLSLQQGSGGLKVFLYRQQKTHILKLIGQAKEKSKSNLFFDCLFTAGRYYVFAQAEGKPCTISYFGQGKPVLSISQQIQTDGLKNDFTQYLPISKIQAKKQNDPPLIMPRQIHRNGPFNQTGVSFHSNAQSDKLSKLRQNFVDYLLKDSQNMLAKSKK